jgi:hypothetical protein
MVENYPDNYEYPLTNWHKKVFEFKSKCLIPNCTYFATFDGLCDVHLIQSNEAYDKWLEDKKNNCPHTPRHVSFEHTREGTTAFCLMCERDVTEELGEDDWLFSTEDDLERGLDLQIESEVERRVFGE